MEKQSDDCLMKQIKSLSVLLLIEIIAQNLKPNTINPKYI